ncbi:MAG: hypothetical protein HY719_02350 [Planctomycetes bacterium]|nr:hypothetical protein [Planctomycetota bacterium]
MRYSEPLKRLPPISFDYVFIRRELHGKALSWLKDNRKDILGERGNNHHGSV